MKLLFSLIFCVLTTLIFAQAPSIVKAVGGTVTEPNATDQEGWKSNEWNGLFFYAGTGSPTKLCVTDGTSAGTVFVSNIGSGTMVATIPAQDFMYIITNRIFSFSPFTFEAQIWKSDGTAVGTSLVYTMAAAPTSSVSLWTSDRDGKKNFSVSSNTMFFGGYDATNGNELWVTDGTAAGTHIVKDLKTGTGNSSPQAFCKIGADVFFTCMQTASERKLWKTDGTAAGTVQIAVAEPFYILDNAVGMVNNKMIFYAHNTVDGYEPYVSDGTAAGTMMLSNINPAGHSWITQSQNVHLRFNSAYCFFVANNGTAKALWRTDGTPAGTIQLTTNAQAAASDVSGGSYTDVDESGLWMIQYDGLGSGANNKLYRSDGTVAGTYLVATGLSYGQYLKIYQSGLWMQSRNTGSPANAEPWRSGGNQPTTNLAFEIAPGNSGAPTFTPISANPFGYFVKNGKLYFFASSNASPDRNLYQYQGDFTFNGSQAAGRWSNAANWNGMITPGITDEAIVNAGTPNALTIDGATAYAGKLTMGNNATASLVGSTDSLIINQQLNTGNNNSFTGNGVLAFQNVNASGNVSITNGFSANRLAVMSNSNLATGDVLINQNVNLVNNSLLTLNTGNVTLAGTSSTITQTGNSYFNTNNTGRLFIEGIGATGRMGAILFPIGTATNYNPATITNSGVDDKFGVRVKPGLNGNYTGETPDNTGYTNGAVSATWFVTEANAGGSNVDLLLQWNQSQELPAFVRSQSYLGHYTGGSWSLGTAGAASGSNPYTFNRSGISTFSPFGIMNNNAVLPLQLLSFTAQKCGNNVCLNWKTANEQNVSHFEIERSTDGRNFTTIKTEAAKNQSLNLYSYEDALAGQRAADKVYYRIRQVDGDGKTKYSAIAFVKQNATLAEVYPTLFSKSFTIQNNSTDNVQLILYSTDGRILKNQSVYQGVNNINFGGSYSGVLFYKLIKKGEVILTGKLIKQ
ncbi:MAG TPA: hypothetical protein PK023_05965 [Chitinophagaceae bacterium]|nr:hypothetical protein [Chitinophagaceae bacterium]